MTTERKIGQSYQTPGGYQGLDCVAGELQLDKGTMSATGIYASASRDRVGDVLEIGGIRLDNHKRNPIVLWDHGLKFSLPIGKTEDPGGLYTCSLHPDADYAIATTFFSQHLLEAEQVYWLIEERIVRAQSIGYRDLVVKPIVVDGRKVGNHLIEVEQLEASWTGIPCNPDAVRAALSRDLICGKSLAMALRESLEPFAAALKVWSPGFSFKTLPPAEASAESDLGDDEAARMDVMADIVGGLLGRKSLLAKGKAAKWEEDKHPRADDGKFGSGGGGGAKPASGAEGSKPKPPKKPAGKPAAAKKPAPKPAAKPASEGAKPPAARAGSKEAQHAARTAVSRILSGAITADSHRELVDHLGKLTVPQLHEIRKEHGLKCPGRLKAQVIEKIAHHFNSKIVAGGSINLGQVEAAVAPFRKEALASNDVRFAQANYAATVQQYGTLTGHRIRDMVKEHLTQLRDLPAGANEDRAVQRRKLAVCAWMLDRAKKDGITGQVEPSSLKDFHANTQRIALGEKLREGERQGADGKWEKSGQTAPWTAFLLTSIRNHFEVGDDVSPEQLWNRLKEGKFQGPRLDAALRTLRADYGTMSQAQFEHVLPLLKERTDVISPAVVDAAARAMAKAGSKRLRRQFKNTAGRWEENKHPRADDGKFGAGGGGSKPAGGAAAAAKEAAKESPKTPAAGGEAAEVKVPKSAMSKAVEFAKAAGDKIGHLEHAAVEFIGKQVDRLPTYLRMPTIGVYRVAMVSYDVAQKAVAAVAAERGNTPEQVAFITKCAAIGNAIGAKGLPLSLEAGGAHGAAPFVAGFVPLGSVGYLAFATATNPLATYRAAAKGAKQGLLKVASLARGGKGFKAIEPKAVIAAMLDQIAAAADPDQWMASYLAALDVTQGDAVLALRVTAVMGLAKKSADLRAGGKTSHDVARSHRERRVQHGSKAMGKKNADQAAEKPTEPLGAQILRKLYKGLRALHEECTKASGPLEPDAGVRKIVDEQLGGMSGIGGAVEKHFGKLYKDLKLDGGDEEAEVEGKSDGEDDVSDEDVAAALGALGGEGEGEGEGEEEEAGDGAGDEGSSDEDEDEDPEVDKRLKALETRLRHKKRLLAAKRERGEQ